MALIKNPQDLKDSINAGTYSKKAPPARKRLLMVHPQHFRIEYAINPHMRDENGAIRSVDSPKALMEWKEMIKVYESLGLEIEILDGAQHLPDMVFAANPAFPYWNSDLNRAEVILSNMANPQRRDEVKYFENYFRAQKYQVKRIDSHLKFEGTGDAILDAERNLIWCGHGFRSDYAALEQVSELSKTPLVPLQLVNDNFYHLDTCFAVLDKNTVVIQEEAFDKKSVALIEAGFENCIRCNLQENIKFFGGNLFCPDQNNIILDKANIQLIAQLEKQGFKTHPVESGEYRKAGGSVFCTKLFIW